MRIVFFGTPDYVLPVLENLHETYKTKKEGSPIIAVVTQRPKPVGRKKVLTHSAIDQEASKKKVPIYYFAEDVVKNNIKADVGILASYGAIIPKSVINHFPHGILNIHPSLLPKWRGASPVQATLVAGDKQTGVTIIKLDEQLDHGPIISQFKEKVLYDDTTKTLRKRLFDKSADILTTLLPAYIKGKITPRKQDHKKATFTSQVKKEHAFIDPKALQAAIEDRQIKRQWNILFIKNFTNHYSPITIHRFIRAMQPWPVAWISIKLKVESEKFKVKRLKILKAHLEPSTINHKLSLTQGEQSLVIDEVQLEGKNPVSWKQFKEGYPNAIFE